VAGCRTATIWLLVDRASVGALIGVVNKLKLDHIIIDKK
jgi:hypothetical protein